MRRFQSLLTFAAAFSAAALISVAGCSHDSSSSAPTSPPPGDSSKSTSGLSISIDSGISGQTAIVGTTIPVRVHVTQAGIGVPNASVAWTVTGGHGSLSSSGSTTDGLGEAQVQWTLGDSAGSNTLTAAITGAQVTVFATGVASTPSLLAKVSPDSQTVVAGATLPITARTVDRFGNPVGGVTVLWSTTAGTLSATTTVSSSSGNATTNLVTGTAPGRYAITATMPDRASVTFIVIAQ